MDYLKKIDSILDKLEKSNEAECAEKIKSLENAASVGSELLMSVTHELLSFIKADKYLKELIEEDVLELKKYCWSIGLNVK